MNIIRPFWEQKPWKRRTIISDLESWCNAEHRRVGWYESRRGPFFSLQEDCIPYVSRAAFTFLSSSFLSDPVPAFRPLRLWMQPKKFRCLLRNVYCYNQDGAVRSFSNEPLNELSPNWENSLRRFARNRRDVKYFYSHRVRVKELSTIISAPGFDSYYHWLLQAAPRLINLQPFIELIEAVYVPETSSMKQIDFLSSMGIPRKKIRTLLPNTRYLFDQLIASSIPGSEGAISSWALTGLKELAQTNERNVGSRKNGIYLYRGGRRRRILNEEAIAEACEERGIKVFDGSKSSISEQAEMCRSAEIIVGAHGAALSNMIFNSKCRVLEIFSRANLVENCYTHLAEKSGHNYFWSVASDHSEGRDGDFIIDENHFKALLDQLLEDL